MHNIGPCDLGNIVTFISKNISLEIINEFESLRLVRNDENKFYEAALRVHPLSKMLSILEVDSQNSIKENRLIISMEGYRLIQMYDDLLTLENNAGLPRIISKINVPESFFSGLFELLVSASYTRMGYAVEVLSESSNRTPDFKIASDCGWFYVECKSLENKLRNAEAAWEKFSRRVNKLASQIGWQLGINIIAHDYITHKQADELTEHLKTSLRPPLDVEISFDHSTVYVTFLDQFDNEQPYKEMLFSSLDFGRVEFSLRWDGNIYYVSQISYVNVKGFFSGDYVKQAKRLFNKGDSQLPRNDFSVLHLEIPHGSHNEFIPSMDAIYPHIYRKLNREDINIDSVIISSLSKQPITASGNAVMRQDHVIIPKHNFKTVDFQGISLLGSHDAEGILIKLKENPSEGTIFVDLFEQSLQAQFGCYIFSVVSEQGDYQIKIGLISEKIIRVEVITPAIGRLMCNYDHSDILIENGANKMAVSFDVHLIRTALNGVMLAISDEITT